MWTIRAAIFVSVLLGGFSPAALGMPVFEGATFGKQSTHCNAGSARATVVPGGGGISVAFDLMQAESGTKLRGHDRVRCDVTLKLVAPLEAPAAIQFDVRGDSIVTGSGSTTAFVTMQGRKEVLNFHPVDDDGIQRVIVNLPKGAKKLDMTFEAFTKGSFSDSTAIISIDSLDIGFKRK